MHSRWDCPHCGTVTGSDSMCECEQRREHRKVQESLRARIAELEAAIRNHRQWIICHDERRTTNDTELWSVLGKDGKR